MHHAVALVNREESKPRATHKRGECRWTFFAVAAVVWLCLFARYVLMILSKIGEPGAGREWNSMCRASLTVRRCVCTGGAGQGGRLASSLAGHFFQASTSARCFWCSASVA